MPTYKAISRGFYGDCLREPGKPTEIVVTDAPLDPIPDWLVPVEVDFQKPKRVRRGGKKKIVADAPQTPAPVAADFPKGSVQEL